MIRYNDVCVGAYFHGRPRSSVIHYLNIRRESAGTAANARKPYIPMIMGYKYENKAKGDKSIPSASTVI
jgi:hypothetical protein